MRRGLFTVKRGCSPNQRAWLSIVQSTVRTHGKVFLQSKSPKHCERYRWSQITVEVIMQFNIDTWINPHFKSLASNSRQAENKREMRKIKGCWFRRGKKPTTTQHQKAAAAAAAIAAIQTALQRSHHYHLAQHLPGCSANTWDKQMCGLCFKVPDRGLSNSQRNQSFELEWLSQGKKHQFSPLTSHSTAEGCLLPARKREVCAVKKT